MPHRARPASRRAALTMGVVVLVTGAVQTLPDMELQEVDRWEAPDGFDVSGLVGNASGGLFVWSSHRVIELDSDLDPVADYQLHGGAVLAVGLREAGAVEVFRSTPPTIVSINRDGSVRDSVALQLHTRVVDAILTPAGWVILTASGEDPSINHLVRVLSPGGDVQLLAVTELTGSLWSDGACIYLAQITSPHKVEVFDLAGHLYLSTSARGDFVDSLAVALGSRGGARIWVGLPALPVGPGFVQTIADLSSDWRVMALYDAEGRPVRSRVYRVPMGFLASDVDKQTLIASRRLNSAEVVRYRWRWKHADDMTPQPIGRITCGRY